MTEHGDRLGYLREVDLFRGLSELEIEQLASMMETRAYRAGELIVGPDTPPGSVYIVREGTVRLFHRGPGEREVTVELLGRGRLFGISALFGRPRRGLLAAAATDAAICVVEARRFLELIGQQPTLLLNLVGQLADQLIRAEERLGQVAAPDPRARLAAALLRLAAAREPGGPGEPVYLNATQAGLAREIGVRRETVNRLIAEMEAEGYLRRAGRRLVLLDPERLATGFDLA